MGKPPSVAIPRSEQPTEIELGDVCARTIVGLREAVQPEGVVEIKVHRAEVELRAQTKADLVDDEFRFPRFELEPFFGCRLCRRTSHASGLPSF